MRVCILSALVFASGAFSSQVIKTTVSTTSGHWKNVTFSYPQEMSVSSDNPRLPHGCVVIKRPEQKQPEQKQIAVQCQAKVKLARPVSVVARWQQQETRDGYFIFNEPELGAVNVHAEIMEVTHGVNPASITPVNQQASPVTGIFIKYATDVRQYTFRDEVTGHFSTINATPNHPFYVVNARRYKAVGDLSRTDQLINIFGHLVALVCPQGKTRHCGCPWHGGRIVPVYNLEVYQQHRYFAGEAQILVHNVYKCSTPGCGYSTSRLYRMQNHERTHTGEKPFVCKTCGKRYPSRTSLNAHIKTHERQSLVCPECGQEFKGLANYRNHIDFKHRGRVIECPLCGEKNGVSYYKTYHHLRTVHEISDLRDARQLAQDLKEAEEDRNLAELYSDMARHFSTRQASRPVVIMGASTSTAMSDSIQPPL